VWAAGVSYSTNFPVVAAFQSTNAGFSDGVLVRLSAASGAIESSTYFGGSADDSLWDLATDARGYVHLVGETYSPSLPGLSASSILATNAGNSDILIALMAPDGVFSSTFYGATGDELAYGVAADAAGNAYVAGRVRSVNFPVSSTNVAQAVYGGERTDGFVLKVAYEPTLTAARMAEGVQVSWPAPNPGFVLESTPAVPGTGPWKLEKAPVEVLAGRHVVALPLGATNCLFRLRWAQ
jgi:hypothetical protein